MIQETTLPEAQVAASAGLVDALLDRFNREGIVYCHWKSNIDLADVVAGKTDLDLLVDRRSVQRASAILADLGYRMAVSRWGADPPGICHYYGYDLETGRLVHVHLFSRVLTGESLVKSHLFPLEEMLLDNAEYTGLMRVPTKPAELVLFTLRAYIKFGSLPDVLALQRKLRRQRKEIRWLQEGDNLPKAVALLRQYCPVMDEGLFTACADAIHDRAPLWRRLALALKVRRTLGVYAKHTPPQRMLAYFQLLWAEGRRRLVRSRGHKVLRVGGALIAVVGADATGKSTLVAETARWLGEALTVRTVHVGKPPTSLRTAPLNAALALTRRLGAARRWGSPAEPSPEADGSPTRHGFSGLSSLLYAVRAVTLAWDRRRLILWARRLAARGEIVICDRYPTQTIGAMDSPRLVETPAGAGTGRAVAIYNRLVREERRLYAEIPPPDIVLALSVSLETAMRRNRERAATDEEGYLVSRHHQNQDWRIPGARYCVDIDTEGTIEETARRVRETIWALL